MGLFMKRLFITFSVTTLMFISITSDISAEIETTENEVVETEKASEEVITQEENQVEDINLDEVFEEKTEIVEDKYKITFKSTYDIEVPEELELAEGTIARLPQLNIKGYEFKGWRYKGILYAPHILFTMPSEDVELIAELEEINYSVKFESEIEVVLPENMILEENESFRLPGLTHATEKFVGWIHGQELVEKNTIMTHKGDQLVFRALWESSQFMVSYTSEDITSNMPETKLVNYKEKVTISDMVPEREGYVFTGWTMKDKQVKPGNKFDMPHYDVEIKANWKKDFFNLTYVSEKGTENMPESRSVEFQEKVTISTQIPERKGYVFIGWKMNNTVLQGGNRFNMPAHAITLTAVWEKDFFDLNYISEEDTTKMPESVKVEFQEKVTISTQIPEREGYVFKGWKMKDTVLQGGNRFKMPAYEITLTAVWDKDFFSLNYISDKNTTNMPESRSVEFQEKVTISEMIPKLEGYVFKGWQFKNAIVEGGNRFDMPAETVNLHAVWEKDFFNLTYVSEEGTENMPASRSVEFKEKVTISEMVPELEGYVFKGWKMKDKVLQGGNRFNMPAYSVTLTAVWEQAKYNVTFDAEGADFVPENTTAFEGDEITLRDLSKPGHVFLGYEHEGTMYAGGTTFIMPNKDVILKAVWDLKEYNVTFTSEGDVVLPANMQLKAFETFRLVSVVRDGYTFKGWEYNGKMFMPNSIVIVEENDMEFKAVWEQAKYNVTFDAEGADFVPENTTAFEGDEITLRDLTKPGHVFLGYEHEGSIYAGGSTFIMPNKDVVLKAVWEQKTYNITFTSEGDVVLPANMQLKTLETFRLEMVERNGFIFKGWEYNGKLYNANTIITVEENNMEFKAIWEEIKYNVIFDAEGADFIPENTTAVEGEEITLRELTKVGHKFLGYEYAGVIYPGGSTFIVPKADVVLKAVWEVNKYKITYVLEGVETIIEDHLIDFKGIHSISKYIPKKIGHTFKGWKLVNVETEVDALEDKLFMAEDTLEMPANHIKLVAQFTKNDYKVTYVASDADITTVPKAHTSNYGDVIKFKTPIQKGYIFTGWMYGSKVYTEKDLFTIQDNDVEFVATWEKVQEDQKVDDIDKVEIPDKKKPNADKTIKAPKTGLSNETMMYIGVAVIASILAVVLIVIGKKRHKRI